MSSTPDPIHTEDGVLWNAYAERRLLSNLPPVTVYMHQGKAQMQDYFSVEGAKELSVRLGAAAIQARIGADRNVLADAERLLAEQFDQAVQKLLPPAEPETQDAETPDSPIKVGDRVVLPPPYGTEGTVVRIAGDLAYVDNALGSGWRLDDLERVDTQETA